jgi:hypothetical protein
VKDEVKEIRATGVRVISSHVDIANARIAFQNDVSPSSPQQSFPEVHAEDPHLSA